MISYEYIPASFCYLGYLHARRVLVLWIFGKGRLVLNYWILAALATGALLLFGDDKEEKQELLKQQALKEKEDELERERVRIENEKFEQKRKDLIKRQDFKREQEEKKRQDLLRQEALEKQRFIAEIELHRAVLTRNLERAVKKNNYGGAIAGNNIQIEKVLYEFIQNFKYKKVDFQNFKNGERIDKSAKKVIFEQLAIWKERDRESGFDINTLPTNGHEFEHWVADGLNKFGWDTKVTVASGDQGIDVIAKKKGKTVGLQCKLLKSSVGNKAVQEAFAGKTFHKTDAVCVMSNASYTPSAQKLAADTGVKLLSHHDIPNLYEKMFSE